MSNSQSNRIFAVNAADVLTLDVDQTISGAGQLGVNTMALVNNGVIDANQLSNPLIIDPSSQGVTNNATLQASGGGTLRLEGGEFTNTRGTIQALDSSFVVLSNATVLGGTLETGESARVNVPVRRNGSLRGRIAGEKLSLDVAGTLSIDIDGALPTDVVAIAGSISISGDGIAELTLSNPPAMGAHLWGVVVADADDDGAGSLNGAFRTHRLPLPPGRAGDMLGRVTPVVYRDNELQMGLTIHGDSNFDGAVRFDDFLALASHFGATGDWTQGDFNGDGDVRFPDFLLLQAKFGQALAGGLQPISVPEPDLVPLHMLTLFLLAFRLLRRQRTKLAN